MYEFMYEKFWMKWTMRAQRDGLLNFGRKFNQKQRKAQHKRKIKKFTLSLSLYRCVQYAKNTIEQQKQKQHQKQQRNISRTASIESKHPNKIFILNI